MIEIARLLARAQENLTAYDISMWFREYDGPPEGAEIILSQDLSQYYISSKDDGDPLCPALASVLRSYAKDPGPWEPLIRTLIRYGADFHALVRRKLKYLDQSEYLCPLSEYGTPLDELFTHTFTPFEGQTAANGWLHILQSEGYDISAYLNKDSDLHVESMQLTYPSHPTVAYETERKLVFDLRNRPTVSWDWWISPSSSTSLLREEFRLMGMTPLPDGLLIARSWKDAWPIRCPAWSELHQSYGDVVSRERYKKLLDLTNERAAKREMKKARKSARTQKHKGPRKVPAWPT